MHLSLKLCMRVLLPAALIVFAPSKLVAEDVSAVSEPSQSGGVVERLQVSGSAVVIDAPELLLERAAFVASENQQQSEENAEEQESTEHVVKTKSGKTVGYRVQVFADNNARSAKAEARQRERAIGQAFPAFGTYVSYASPYWRLRVGDFKSQYDAEKAAAEIRKAFPRYAREVRVVRDRIR